MINVGTDNWTFETPAILLKQYFLIYVVKLKDGFF